MKKRKCNKKGFNKKHKAVAFIKSLIKGGYNKKPWRDEISVYRCDICKKWHTSSKDDGENHVVLKGKDFFSFQKEKWSNFLRNYSHKQGNITN